MSDEQLNVSDMVQIKKIIEVVCSRGAIQASEMETVGVIYNKLNVLLESLNKKSDELAGP